MPWTRDFGLEFVLGKICQEISDLDIIPSASNLDIEYGIYIKPANAGGLPKMWCGNCKIILNKANTRSIGILKQQILLAFQLPHKAEQTV